MQSAKYGKINILLSYKISTKFSLLIKEFFYKNNKIIDKIIYLFKISKIK